MYSYATIMIMIGSIFFKEKNDSPQGLLVSSIVAAPFISKTYFSYSKKTTLSLVDQIVTDHDQDVLDMKAKTESMWKNCPSKRERRTLAAQEIPGYCFFGDNIGKIIKKELLH